MQKDHEEVDTSAMGSSWPRGFRHRINWSRFMVPLPQRSNMLRVLRLVGIAAAISLGVTALVALDYWLEDHSRATVWRVKLICLIALELGYGLLAVGFGLLSPVLGFFLYRGLRQPHRRSASARCLLLCVSLLLAFALAEGTAAIWWRRIHEFWAAGRWPSRNHGF